MLREYPRRVEICIPVCCRTNIAGVDLKVWRRIDRMAGHDHPEIQMWTICEATSADGCNPSPAIDRLATFRQCRCNQPEMAVDANEPVMLDQDLEPSYPVALDSN